MQEQSFPPLLMTLNSRCLMDVEITHFSISNSTFQMNKCTLVLFKHAQRFSDNFRNMCLHSSRIRHADGVQNYHLAVLGLY